MYHSAHDFLPLAGRPMDRFEYGENVAFQYDVMAGPLPKEYEKCDVIYAEPAWQHGFETFNRRARVEDQRSYKNFVRSVGDRVREARRIAPIVLIYGYHALPFLPDPDEIVETVLNGRDALALVYESESGIRPEMKHHTSTEVVIDHLAQQYDRIGDFCCGYGRTGMIFAAHGKKWTLSDYNAMCVGVISQLAPGWEDQTGGEV